MANLKVVQQISFFYIISLKSSICCWNWLVQNFPSHLYAHCSCVLYCG